jgi:prepilin-type N-terminal cleavage/methylation domain-containing protein
MQRAPHGFTLIELLLTISLIALLGALAAPFLSNFLLTNATHSTHLAVLSNLRKAQQYAVQGKNNSAWGVCQTGGAIRLYRGSCASPVYSENTSVPNGVTVSGLTDISFSKLRGEPSVVTNITISSTLSTQTITVEGAGLITQN